MAKAPIGGVSMGSVPLWEARRRGAADGTGGGSEPRPGGREIKLRDQSARPRESVDLGKSSCPKGARPLLPLWDLYYKDRISDLAPFVSRDADVLGDQETLARLPAGE